MGGQLPDDTWDGMSVSEAAEDMASKVASGQMTTDDPRYLEIVDLVDAQLEWLADLRRMCAQHEVGIDKLLRMFPDLPPMPDRCNSDQE